MVNTRHTKYVSCRHANVCHKVYARNLQYNVNINNQLGFISLVNNTFPVIIVIRIIILNGYKARLLNSYQ